MAFLVQQNQLFVLDRAKGRDVEGTVGIHQQDLVGEEGRSGTELGQGLVTARTSRDASFVME